MEDQHLKPHAGDRVCTGNAWAFETSNPPRDTTSTGPNLLILPNSHQLETNYYKNEPMGAVLILYLQINSSKLLQWRPRATALSQPLPSATASTCSPYTSYTGLLDPTPYCCPHCSISSQLPRVSICYGHCTLLAVIWGMHHIPLNTALTSEFQLDSLLLNLKGTHISASVASNTPSSISAVSFNSGLQSWLSPLPPG